MQAIVLMYVPIFAYCITLHTVLIRPVLGTMYTYTVGPVPNPSRARSCESFAKSMAYRMWAKRETWWNAWWPSAAVRLGRSEFIPLCDC